MDRKIKGSSGLLKNNWTEIYNTLKSLPPLETFELMYINVDYMDFSETVKSQYYSKIKSMWEAGKIYTRVYLLKSDVLFLAECIEEGDHGDSEGFGVEPDTWIVSYIDKNGNVIVPFNLFDSELIKEAEKKYGSF